MSGVSYVLDTCILVHLIRNDATGQAIDKKYALSSHIHSNVVSIVTHGELWTFAEGSKPGNKWGMDKRDKLKKLLADLVTIDVNEFLVEAYAEIDIVSRRHKTGAIRMGKNDLWIAATAKVYNATVLTIDGDFDHLDQKLVKHERYSNPRKPKLSDSQ